MSADAQSVSRSPRSAGWKEMLELTWAVAVLALLLFIGLRLRQAQRTAISDSDLASVENLTNVRNAINQNAAVWVRGGTGGDLSAEEAVVFENLVVMINDGAFFDYMRLDRMGAEEIARSVMDDYAAFLHDRPGARRVWLAREEKLLASRNVLNPEADDFSFWKEGVTASLSKLDGAGLANLRAGE